jgi:membrane protein
MNKLATLRNFAKDIYGIWIDEKPNQLAAALAYFGMFSFSAMIYLAYRFAGILINEAAAGERFYGRLEAVFGAETAAFIRDSVAAISAASSGGSWIISLVSTATLLFAAMGLFMQLTYVLNRIWGVPLIQREQRMARLRQRLFAFIMVIALGLLVILATVVNLAFAWFGSIIQNKYGGSDLLALLNGVALLGLIILANAFMYKVLPDVKLTWRDVWPGSISAGISMVIGGLVMGLYFKLGGFGSAFQAAGAFAVVMITIYYFAQIFLLGAIITRVYAQKHGSMIHPQNS